MTSPADHARIGGLGDLLGTVFEPIADVFTSAVDRVPGGTWARTAVDDGATWLGDAAKTFPGYQAIAIVSASLAQGVAAAYGVNLVALAMVAPGLAAGKDVTEAFIKGVADYATKLAIAFTAVGVGAAYGAGGVYGVAQGVATGTVSAVPAGVAAAKAYVLDPALNLLRDERFQKVMADLGAAAKSAGLSPADSVRQMKLTPQKLAADYGIREDAAAIAVNGSLGADVFDLNAFDPLTGRVLGAPPRDSSTVQRELSAARHDGDLVRAATLQRELATVVLKEAAPALAQQETDDATRRAASLLGFGPPPPVAPGFVRVVRDEGVTARRLKGLGTFALLTSPLWGYALFRHLR